MRESWSDNRSVIVVVLAFEVLLLALWPLAARLDSSVDDVRPLMLDIQEMAEVQYPLTVETGRPEPVEVAPGDEVPVGGLTFEASPGVSVRVETDSSSYCVTATNETAERTRCWGFDDNPVSVAGRDPGDS